MEQAITSGDLLTVAGASFAAGIVAQFVKLLFDAPVYVIRGVALLSGLLFVVSATVISLDETSVLTMLLAAVVGMQAGLAAWAAIDTAQKGFTYEASRASSRVRDL
jgi:hypothetical protein